MNPFARHLILFMAFIGLFLPDETVAAPIKEAQEGMRRIRQKEPAFTEVVGEALRKENLGWSEMETWKKKMAKAPWFPKLYVGYDRNLRETNALSITDNISVTGSGVTVGPRDSDYDETVVAGDNIHVRAVWELDQIVFPSSALNLTREKRELTRARLSFDEYLFKIYSERRKLQGQYLLVQGTQDSKVVILGEQIQALTERLDALTHGAFSNRWVQF